MALSRTIIFILTVKSILASPAQPQLKLRAEDYRIPELYSPSSYQVELSLAQEAFTETRNDFAGKVTILFTFTNQTDYISLHAQHDFITINKLTFNGIDLAVDDYSINSETDILRISVNEINIVETYTLIIEYTGRLSTGDMYGFYKSSYVDEDNITKYLVTTQFEPTYARRAFPCFDEPASKATFTFTFTFPSNLNVLFNTQQSNTVTDSTTGLTTTTFNTTPKMPTYLVAFIISEFTCTTGTSIGTAPYQVCSRKESAATRDLAVTFGPQLLSSLNAFTNYEYSREMSKMDQVAIPDFAAGAMENWGLVTYRETALLWDPNESSNRYQQNVVTVIAHEFTHQWFGNLVTCKWWSEIFLNEGFATYFEYHITHEVLPDWQLNKQFVIEEVHSALATDALENTHALQSPCSTPAEISSNFDTIAYSKGGSVLRMLERIMQLENFRNGLRTYLATYAESNTEPENLWAVLSASVVASVSKLPADLPVVMENWTKIPGFPLLTVSLNGNEVTVSQERFLLSGEDRTSKWYLPVSHTTSVDTNKFQTTTPNAWLTPTESLTFTLPEGATWIVLNNQQSGYYRVNYDNALWERIRTALHQENHGEIVDLNRAQIVDDLFNIARANKIQYSNVFSIINFLAKDTSYYSWYAAFTGFNFLLRRVGDNSKLGQAISSDILGLMSNLIDTVPISELREDDQIYTLTQVLALTWACRLGSESCVEEVKQLFSNYKSSGIRPNRNLRTIVYCNGLRYSNDPSDWEFLWNAYTQASGLATEQVTLLSALGCTKDPSLLTEYLQKSITDDSGIRSQDALSVFSSVYSGNPEGIDVAFDFLIQNYEVIGEKYNSWNSLGNLIKGIAERFTTDSQIAKLTAFIETGNLPEEFRVAANEAVEIAQENMRWLTQFEENLLDYYGLGSASTIGVSFLSIIMAFILLQLTK